VPSWFCARRLESRRLRLAVCIACAAAMSCRSDSTAPHPLHTPNFVRLASDPGDWVGSGKLYYYTQANAIITLAASAGTLRVRIAGEEGWSGFFASPGAELQRGVYYDALSWYGGNVCDRAYGWFSVDSVTYDSTTLVAIDMRFEQQCSPNGGPGLHGTIHWRADDPTRPPGPVYPVPAGLWQPADTAIPHNGNYVYLKSDPGDWVGDGRTWLYIPPPATILVASANGLLTIDVSNPTSWFGEFKAMNTLTDTLLPGYYGPGLGRYPFHNLTKGGFDWFGDGRGCNHLRGWFVIDHIEYAKDTLKALDLRFEQHCEEVPPSLHGAIHWVH
jgi:hypothetical protein